MSSPNWNLEGKQQRNRIPVLGEKGKEDTRISGNNNCNIESVCPNGMFSILCSVIKASYPSTVCMSNTSLYYIYDALQTDNCITGSLS